MPVRRETSSSFFQAEDGIRDIGVTGVQTCALPISRRCTPRVRRRPRQPPPRSPRPTLWKGPAMPELTGGQVVARALKEYGVSYVAGIPGHGIWTLTDAFLEEGSEIPFIQVYHEQSAVHLADGYYRATGRPMAAVTSIGAGASNTVIGLATAYTDSTSTIVITGGPPTHMRGHGLLQELERFTANEFPKVAEAVSKRNWVAQRVDELPFKIGRA